jgi:hypothetical protein
MSGATTGRIKYRIWRTVQEERFSAIDEHKRVSLAWPRKHRSYRRPVCAIALTSRTRAHRVSSVPAPDLATWCKARSRNAMTITVRYTRVLSQ